MEIPTTELIGRRLKAARRLEGLSQGDVERRSGIPKARISRYENGHVAPSIRSLLRLCKALGHPAGEILGAIGYVP